MIEEKLDRIGMLLEELVEIARMNAVVSEVEIKKPEPPKEEKKYKTSFFGRRVELPSMLDPIRTKSGEQR